MTILSIKPIFQKKCEYADIEYISESIYEQLVQYVHEHNTIDMQELTKGKFEILVNWKNTSLSEY